MAVLPSDGPDPGSSLRSNPAAASDPPPGADEKHTALCQPDSCSPAPEHRAGITAFMKVLDSLQKRRMNTGLCERIRKVYGDLECEYCGKGRGAAPGRAAGAPCPAAPAVPACLRVGWCVLGARVSLQGTPERASRPS